MRTCIITGGNSGIGFDVAKRLVCHNYDVVLACRNPHAGNLAVEKIQKQFPEASISFMHLNLSSKKSVQEFVRCFSKSNKSLQLLINNAGIFGTHQVTITEDGLEQTFQVNHLGHFYLTLLLLENLKQNSPSRIIMVSSSLHDPSRPGYDKSVAHLDFENLMLTEIQDTYSGILAYKNSKLANILFAKELSRRLPAGCGVTINAMNPGWIPKTGLWKGNPCLKGCIGCCFGICGKTASLEDSSDCLVHMSCSDGLEDVTGRYFENCEEIQSSPESMDTFVAARLWDFSIELLKIRDETCILPLNV